MSTAYFWDDKNQNVLQLTRPPGRTVWYQKELRPYIGMYCLDPGSRNSTTRYGMYYSLADSVKWASARPDEFPAKFRLSLLILGVS